MRHKIERKYEIEFETEVKNMVATYGAENIRHAAYKDAKIGQLSTLSILILEEIRRVENLVR